MEQGAKARDEGTHRHVNISEDVERQAVVGQDEDEECQVGEQLEEICSNTIKKEPRSVKV